MINKGEIQCRFKKSIDSYDENAHVQKMIVERLWDLFRYFHCETAGKTLEIGCGTGLLSEKLAGVLTSENLFINDLVDKMCLKTARKCDIDLSHCFIGDIEEIGLREKYDLIISTSTFQWFSQPSETLKKLSSCIYPGGMMLFTTFGEYNLREILITTGSSLHYLSQNELTTLLTPYFDILFTEESLHKVYFSDPLDVLRHLKKTGANANAGTQVWTKGRIEKFSTDYNALFSSDGQFPLTYHPLYFVCRKK